MTNTTTKRNSTFTFLSGIRGDGKYKVTLHYPGAPNMFGGFEHGTSYTKLYSADKCRETLVRDHYEFHNIPAELTS